MAKRSTLMSCGLVLMGAAAIAAQEPFGSDQWERRADGSVVLSKRAAKAALEVNRDLAAERDALARRLRMLQEAVRKAQGKCV